MSISSALKREIVLLEICLSFDSRRLLPDKPFFGLAIGRPDERKQRLGSLLQWIGESVRWR